MYRTLLSPRKNKIAGRVLKQLLVDDSCVSVLTMAIKSNDLPVGELLEVGKSVSV